MTADQFAQLIIAWLDQFVPFWRGALIALVVFYVAAWFLLSLWGSRGDD
jgi:hypothetical protein